MGLPTGGGGVALEARGQEGTDALCSVLRGHWGHKRCALACGPRWNGTSTRIRVGHGRLAPAATVRVRTLSRCGQRSSRRRDGAPPLPPRPWRWPMHGPMRGRGRARGARYAERARGLGTRTRLLLRIYLIRIMIVDKAVLTATCTDDRTKVCGHWGHLQLSLRRDREGPSKNSRQTVSPCVRSQGNIEAKRVGHSLTWQDIPKRKPSFASDCRAHRAAASRVWRVASL